jgi:uncharacterized membrane protein YfcA
MRCDGAVSFPSTPTVVAVGMGIGFLSGLFGKGGSAIATPVLHALGVPSALAVGSPLPAALPATVAAAGAYQSERLVERRIALLSIAWGVPATVAGAIATRWIGGGALVVATEVLVIALGVRLLARPAGDSTAPAPPTAVETSRVVVVALAVGLASGLLANSGGFLLAPLYVSVLRLPIKRAFATSLVVAAVLTVPATILHALLGHIDWSLTVTLALSAAPLAYVGGKVALRTPSAALERCYGAGIAVLGAALLLVAR